jgi:hypothetical protein
VPHPLLTGLTLFADSSQSTQIVFLSPCGPTVKKFGRSSSSEIGFVTPHSSQVSVGFLSSAMAFSPVAGCEKNKKTSRLYTPTYIEEQRQKA